MAIIRSKESVEKIPFSYPLGIDEHYDNLVKIAEDPDTCWYCGKKASGTIRCTYSTSQSYNKLFEEKRVKRTYPFQVHICKDCLHNHERIESAGTLGCGLSMIPGLIFAVLYVVYSGFPDRVFGKILIGLIWGFGLGALLGVFVVSPIVKRIVRHKIVKHEKRTLEEHPFIRAMKIYESGVKTKDEYRIMLAAYSFEDVEESLETFKEYKKKD